MFPASVVSASGGWAGRPLNTVLKTDLSPFLFVASYTATWCRLTSSPVSFDINSSVARISLTPFNAVRKLRCF